MSAPSTTSTRPFTAGPGSSSLPLFLRELRRLAPTALSCAAIGVIASLMLARFWRSLPNELLLIGPFVSVLCGALLLGAATVAPDVESGVQSFLSRLPLGRPRQLAVRVGASSAWLLALLALGAAVVARRTPTSGSVEDMKILPALAVLVFPASLLASVVSGRSLVAVGLTPILAALPLAFAMLVGALGAPDDLVLPAGVLAVPVLLGAVAAAYLRGYPVRPSLVPAGWAGGVIGCAAGLLLLTIGGRRAYAEVTAEVTTSVYPLDAERGLWLRTEQRSVRWPATASTAQAWVVTTDGPLAVPDEAPGASVPTLGLDQMLHGIGPFSTAPGGERALVLGTRVDWHGVRELLLVDRGGVVLRDTFLRDVDLDVNDPWPSTPGPHLWAEERACAWLHGDPWVCSSGAASSPLSGEAPFPAGHVGFGAGGAWIGLRRASDGAVAVWTPGLKPPAAPRVVDADGTARGAALSPGGSLLVTLHPDRCEVHRLTGDDAVVRVELPAGTEYVDVNFAPSEDRVWIGFSGRVGDELANTYETSGAVLVDVATKRTSPAPLGAIPRTWSRSGRRYAAASHDTPEQGRVVWVDADEERPRAREVAAFEGAGPGRIAFDGEDALGVLGFDGARRSHPLVR